MALKPFMPVIREMPAQTMVRFGARRAYSTTRRTDFGA